MKHYKGYRIRLYPTKDQEELLWKHIHACRFIWNYMLELQEETYNNGGRFISHYDMNRLLTPLKKKDEYSWLNEVSCSSLGRVCEDLSNAYKKFFAGINRRPKFKSRKNSKMTYPICGNRFHFNADSTVTIQKLQKVKIKEKNIPNDKTYNQRITYTNHKWILSFEIECENQTLEVGDVMMGIDLGIKELAVVAYGENEFVFHNINKSKRVRTLEHKLKHIQKVIARKYRTNKSYDKTNSIKKYEEIEKQINYKLTNIRNNYIHQITHKLVMMHPSRVVVEDLNISGMLKNRYRAKYIAQQKFYEFIRQIQYKCEWNGIEFLKADKWYPSSKTCSRCDKVKNILTLDDRIFRCDYCGFIINRDYNAAINLMKYVPHNERVTA